MGGGRIDANKSFARVKQCGGLIPNVAALKRLVAANATHYDSRARTYELCLLFAFRIRPVLVRRARERPDGRGEEEMPSGERVIYNPNETSVDVSAEYYLFYRVNRIGIVVDPAGSPFGRCW